MHEKVAIITDSMSCIPPEEIKKYDIREVPIRVIFGHNVYRDRVDLSPSEFYSMLAKAEKLPTTAAPSPEHFLNAYREMSREASKIVCITISSKLSATFNSAKIAADMARETLSNVAVEVLDSNAAAAAEGFVVLSAARAAAAGKRMEEVIAAARDVSNIVHLVAVIDTLKYLAKSGRAPRVIAWAGTLLKIKPIVMLKDGVVHPAGRARTSIAALKQMMKMSKNMIVKGLPLHMAVMHAGAPEKAEELKNQIASSYDCSELMLTEFTPVMGAHTGPGLIGVAFYCGAF